MREKCGHFLNAVHGSPGSSTSRASGTACERTQVVGIRWPKMHGYWALQVGAGYKKQRNLHPAQAGMFLKQVCPLQVALQRCKCRYILALGLPLSRRSVSGLLLLSHTTQGVPFKAVVREFRVSPDALMPVGTPITAAHYVPGQRVDIQGWTKNKGFQGAWGAGWPGRTGKGVRVVRSNTCSLYVAMVAHSMFLRQVLTRRSIRLGKDMMCATYTWAPSTV
jgi:hypothetical protein